ncbi:hypothetical protein D3C86_1616100 [compost metagenome]
MQAGAEAERAEATIQIQVEQLLGAARQFVAVVGPGGAILRFHQCVVGVPVPAEQLAGEQQFDPANARLLDVGRRPDAGVVGDQVVDPGAEGVDRPTAPGMLAGQAGFQAL